MTDEEYHEKMFRTNHSNTCSWGWDQYWWECDCGAIPVAELKAEQERRRNVKNTESVRAAVTDLLGGVTGCTCQMCDPYNGINNDKSSSK